MAAERVDVVFSALTEVDGPEILIRLIDVVAESEMVLLIKPRMAGTADDVIVIPVVA